MEQHRKAPWFFVAQEAFLPGKFYIQPVQPSVLELIERRAAHEILWGCEVSGLVASAQYEWYLEQGFIENHSIDTYLKIVELELEKRLNLEVSKGERAFVIPEEEYNKRVARGEFGGTYMPTLEEKRRMGEVFHEVLGEVLDNYYRGCSPERQDLLLPRMRPQRGVEGINKLWGFSVSCEGRRDPDWQYISKPEVVRVRHRMLPLPAEDRHHRCWPKRARRLELAA